MINIFVIVFYLISFKAIWRCLYFWQLKEYRLDRFKDLMTSAAGNQYFLPTRWFLRPKLTVKIIGLTAINLLALTIAINLNPNGSLSAYLVAYLLIPFLAASSVFLFYPLTWVGTKLVIALANKKLSNYQKQLTVIGITGSYGKTSTKEILSHLLKGKYKVLATPNTVNTPIGAALTVLRSLNSTHNVFIVEMGAYRKGEIAAICNLVKPKIGILTGITPQHLSLFGSMDKLIKAKMELIEALPENGLAVVNGDDASIRKMVTDLKKPKVIIYRKPKKALETNLFGGFYQLNIQAAMAVAKHFKLSEKLATSRLTRIPDFKTKLSRKTGLNKAQVIDNSYNANPVGFKAVIAYSSTIGKPKKILVTSGIIELGPKSESIHSSLALKAKSVFNKIILTNKEVYNIFSKTIDKNSKTKVLYLPPTGKLKKYLKSQLDANTVVVLVSKLPKKIIDYICQDQS